MTYQTLPTANEAWGFFGTIDGTDKAEAFAWASAAIIDELDLDPSDPEALTGVRGFLDSRDGRHMADMANELARAYGARHGIERAVARYQTWTTNRAMERDLGIPAGLPYLAGLVQHYAILAETNGDAE